MKFEICITVVDSRFEAYQQSINELREFIMDQTERLKGEISELRTEVSRVGSLVIDKVSTLQTQIEELKTALGDSIDESEATEIVAAIDETTAELKDIGDSLASGNTDGGTGETGGGTTDGGAEPA